MLQKWGCRAEAVANGKEALDALTQIAYDLVLMDVQMPEMDGVEATGHIRRRERATGQHIPIIALTAHAMQGDRDRCLAAGMDDYVPKPIPWRDLLQTLRRWQKPEQAGGNLGKEAEPAPQAQDTVLDHEYLWQSCGNDLEVVQEVVDDFLGKVPPLLTRVEAALQAHDLRQVRFESHTLKGSARTLGEEALGAACEELELCAEQGTGDGASGRLARVRAEYSRLWPLLGDFLREKVALSRQ